MTGFRSRLRGRPTGLALRKAPGVVDELPLPSGRYDPDETFAGNDSYGRGSSIPPPTSFPFAFFLGLFPRLFSSIMIEIRSSSDTTERKIFALFSARDPSDHPPLMITWSQCHFDDPAQAGSIVSWVTCLGFGNRASLASRQGPASDGVVAHGSGVTKEDPA